MTPQQNNPTGISVNYIYLVIYLAALSAFGSFVNDMYLPSLPEMTEFFKCSVPMVQLGLTTGMAGLGLGQIFLGPLSDKYGRKPVLMISLAVFCAAAVVSIYSPTIHFFLICRFFQGLGASGGYFLARTIPADIYGGRTLAKVMAVVGAINGFAPACAPVLGGFVSEHFQWKGVFVFLSIFSVALVASSKGLKETLPPERRLQGKLSHAFSDYKGLLSNRSFMTHVLFKGSALGLLFAYISSAPFIMQTHFGYSQSEFGLIMGFNALFLGAGSMTALKFKILKRAAFIGGIILSASIAAEVAVLFLLDNFMAYELLLIPAMYGMGMIFTVSNTLAMNEGRNNAGAASAVLGTDGYVFGAIVSPLVGYGNIMHSTALVFGVVTCIVLISAFMARALPADIDS